MMEALLAVWMVGLVGLHGSQGFPGGAPSSSCTDMVPDHGSNTLTGTPYSIVTNSSTFTSGTKVNVTIVGTFKGYFLQARIPDTTNIVGTWETTFTSNKFIQCNSVANAAVTHSNGNSKTSLSFYWIPPTTNPPSSVVFVATVVKTEHEWQMAVQSAKVTASGSVVTTKAPAQTTAKPPTKSTNKAPAETTTREPGENEPEESTKTATKAPAETTTKPTTKATTKAPAQTTTKPSTKSTAKPGNSAGCAALAVSGFSLGTLLVVVTAACFR